MRAIVTRATRLEGAATVPGDKSIGHRAVLLAALARGATRVRGLPSGADVQSSLSCVRALGVDVRVVDEAVVLDSPGPAGWRRDALTLDAGNSGTTARLLLGMLAPVAGLRAKLIGDGSLSRRPMRRVAAPLQRMGAQVVLSPDGSLPARLEGAALHGEEHRLEVASAQVKTALLLAGLGAEGTTRVCEPAPSRDHTERMLPLFGAEVRAVAGALEVERAVLRAPEETLRVPGDPSSAAFLAVAAALVPGGQVTLSGVGLNPLRTGAFDVLRAMGAVCGATLDDGPGEPVGTLQVHGALSRPVEISGALIPRLVDELPLLAVAAATVPGVTRIRDAAELRVKESDRIRTVVAGLRAMGAAVEEHADGLEIDGGRPLHGALIDAAHDHRIAMAFTVAGLVADGETVIDGAQWADISFPGFFALLHRLTGGAVRVA